MIPVVIEDLIKNVTNKNLSLENRQFYYDTLTKINKSVSVALMEYDKEFFDKSKNLKS